MELPKSLLRAPLPNLTPWLILLLLLLMPGKLVAADGSAPERMRILYASTATSFAPIWIASDLGIYRKYGLDAEAVLLGGGPLIGSVLLSNSADVRPALARRRSVSLCREKLLKQRFSYQRSCWCCDVSRPEKSPSA